jgi:hypothetical protein
MTYFLRFPDADSWNTVATVAGFIVNDVLVAYTHDHAIDVVGTIPDMDGWHVNFAGVLPDGWDDYLVEPANPYRVFA